jgi:hypothetical protein
MAAEIRRPPTFLVAIAIAGAVLGCVLAVVALVQYAGFAMQDELERKVLTRVAPERAALRQREEARLTHYQWVDDKHDVVRIPVERALELSAAEWSRP